MNIGWWLLIGYGAFNVIGWAILFLGEKSKSYKICEDEYGFFIKKRYWPFWQTMNAATCFGNQSTMYFTFPSGAEEYINSLINKKKPAYHIPYNYPKRSRV